MELTAEPDMELRAVITAISTLQVASLLTEEEVGDIALVAVHTIHALGAS